MFNWAWLAAERVTRSAPRKVATFAHHVPASVIRNLARAKLVYLLRYVYRHSSAQRRRWEEAGLRLSDLRSPDVLTRIPFCDGTQVATHPEDFFCVPEEKLTHVITTSGTTGTAKKIFFTNEDLAHHTRMLGTKLCLLPGASRFLIMYRAFDPTWTVAERAVEQGEMFCLRSGNHLSADEQVRLISEYRIDTLITTPSYAHRITLEARTNLRDLGVRYIILGGQPWSEALRAGLETAWGATALDAWGCNECCTGIAGECPHKTGLHLSETDFWIELIDPDTGLPVDDGEEGQVVVTTLSRRGMPLVRYRLADLTRFLPDDKPCACGVPLRRLARVRGRLDDVIIIGDDCNVFPDEFDEAIQNVKGVSDYQVVMERADYLDRLCLTVESERTGPEVEKEVRDALLTIRGVRASVQDSGLLTLGGIEVVPPGTLSRNRVKPVRIVDKRRERVSFKSPRT